mmetsp:Transcript_18497/g.33372  ORF Transcript_18497/g.33372 Transcript_18497/m.33372 type:complete len:212 (-) Transcript_18497:1975-2610(-)
MDEEETYLLEAERKAKQNYLREEVVEAGYSPELFVAYCESQRGADVNLWTFDELHNCVAEFKKLYKPGDMPEAVQGLSEVDENVDQSEAKNDEKEQAVKQSKAVDLNDLKEPEAIRIAEMSSKSAFIYTVQGTMASKNELASTSSIDIFVTEPEVVPGGLFSSPFIVFYVITTPLGWSVKRRFSDFVWLRQTLANIHPDCFVILKTGATCP